jgi:hypothetical protein
MSKKNEKITCDLKGLNVFFKKTSCDLNYFFINL